jgi:3',5'-cyclic AMP phosphodiesterase CpdA
MFDNASRMNFLGESLSWLEKVLAETPKDLSILVFAHQPPSVVERWAWHAWDKKNSTSFVALMSKYHVGHVFLGHIHGYSTATIDGIPYTVSGGGGAEFASRYGPEGDVNHYVICDVMPDGTMHQKIVKFYKDQK